MSHEMGAPPSPRTKTAKLSSRQRSEELFSLVESAERVPSEEGRVEEVYLKWDDAPCDVDRLGARMLALCEMENKPAVD